MGKPLISVITVCLNAEKLIENTIKSILNQDFAGFEYLIMDGLSSDSTVEIAEKYSERFAEKEVCFRIISERDNGLYDAMNKGIAHAQGDWINFLNSGDLFIDKFVLQHCMELSQNTKADVLYGNSQERFKGKARHIEAYADPRIMDLVPAYRHGSSFVRAKVHKVYKFDLSKCAELDYALDWELIHRLYMQGFKFYKLDMEIQSFQKEGISNNTIRSLWYNYLITSEGRFNLRKFIHFIRITTTTLIKRGYT